MDLNEEIDKEHSKAQMARIAGWIGRDVSRLDQLMHILHTGTYRDLQRASWVISMIAEKHPEILYPYLPSLIKCLDREGIPVALKRNVIRILQFMPVPLECHGNVVQKCFGFLEDPGETVAVRCFSMTVLARLGALYPEISGELKVLLSYLMEEEGSAGFRSRSLRTLKALERQDKAQRIRKVKY